MAQTFNPLEKLAARFLSRSPAVKKVIKLAYTYLMYSIKKKKYSYKVECPLFEISDSKNETFFGYYDKAPDNGDGLVLVMITKASTSNLPNCVDNVELDVFSLEQQRFILDRKIVIKAFNWQQGCRAHWKNKDEFVFNNYDETLDSYLTYVYSISKGKIVNSFPVAVQDSYGDKFFLSLCYKSLAKLRPDYGYFKHFQKPSSDYNSVGIWKVDYNQDNTEMLVSLCDVFKFDFNENIDDFDHKINHIMISPDGNYFIFMHRYYSHNGRRYDRLILSDSNGNLLRVLADYEMVSHCYWYDNNTVLGYLRDANGIDAYWLIDIKTGEYNLYSNKVFVGRGDGHPSVSGEFIVTDTYPDKSRLQSLYLTRKNSSEEIHIGEFFHGFNFSGETRCDLHPRFSSCGDYVYFDSVFSGKRQLYYLDISDIKLNL